MKLIGLLCSIIMLSSHLIAMESPYGIEDYRFDLSAVKFLTTSPSKEKIAFIDAGSGTLFVSFTQRPGEIIMAVDRYWEPEVNKEFSNNLLAFQFNSTENTLIVLRLGEKRSFDIFDITTGINIGHEVSRGNGYFPILLKPSSKGRLVLLVYENGMWELQLTDPDKDCRDFLDGQATLISRHVSKHENDDRLMDLILSPDEKYIIYITTKGVQLWQASHLGKKLLGFEWHELSPRFDFSLGEAPPAGILYAYDFETTDLIAKFSFSGQFFHRGPDQTGLQIAFLSEGQWFTSFTNLKKHDAKQPFDDLRMGLPADHVWMLSNEGPKPASRDDERPKKRRRMGEGSPEPSPSASVKDGEKGVEDEEEED